MKKHKKLLLIMVCLILIAVGCMGCASESEDTSYNDDTTQNNLAKEATDESEADSGQFIDDAELNGPYEVTRVVDGDTIQVKIDENYEKVRFIGVDTPESVSSDESRNCEEGVTASNYTKKRLEGQSVYLEYDAGQRDKYGRLLAYVYLDDEMINETLLRKGYARTMTIQPNVKYASEFSELQKAAKDANKGFWVDDPWS